MRMSLSWQGFRFSSSVCRSHFSGGRYKINRGATFMGILDAGAEEPNSKALRYVISGGAMVFFAIYAGEAHGREIHERCRRGRYAAGLQDLAPESELYVSGFSRV